MFKRSISSIKSFFKEYTLEEIVEASKTLTTGRHSFFLKRAPTYEEGEILVERIYNVRPNLHVVASFRDYELILWVTER